MPGWVSRHLLVSVAVGLALYLVLATFPMLRPGVLLDDITRGMLPGGSTVLGQPPSPLTNLRLIEKRRRPANVRPVLSLTTTPQRLAHVLVLVGQLSAQLPACPIVVNIPDSMKRTGETYDAGDVARLEARPNVTVNRCGTDLGPITKLLPTAERLAGLAGSTGSTWFLEATHIITVDDDIALADGYLKTLVEAVAYAPEGCVVGMVDAINFVGANHVVRYAAGNMMLEGWAGIAYPRSIFTPAALRMLREAIRHTPCAFSDDMVLAYMQASSGVLRLTAEQVLPSSHIARNARKFATPLFDDNDGGGQALHQFQSHASQYAACAEALDADAFLTAAQRVLQ